MTKKKRSLKKGEKRDGAGRPRDYAKEYQRRKKKYPDYSKRWNIGAKKQAVKQKSKRPTQKRSPDKRVTIKQNERKIEQLKQQQFDLQKSIEATEKRIVEQKANYAKFRNYLTDKEKYVVRYLYESGKTRKEIAEIMHRSLDAISKYVKKMLSEEEVEVQQGEPDYESVKSRPENVEKDGAMDLNKERIFTAQTAEEKINKTEDKIKQLHERKDSAKYLFEKKFGRQIDWSKLEDNREYNRIYAKIRYVADAKVRQTEKTDSATRKKRNETDEMRRDRLCTCHMQGKDASGQELKRKVEHDEEGKCPYCFPNSKYDIITDDKGFTKYDRMLMHRNLQAKEWALMHKPNAIPIPVNHTDDCICEKCEAKRVEIERLNQPDPENPRFTLGGKMIPRGLRVPDRPEIPKPEDMKLQDKLQDAGIDIEEPEPSEPQDVVKPTGEDFKEIEKLNKELMRHQHQQDASALRARNLKEKLEALKKKAGEGGKK